MFQLSRWSFGLALAAALLVSAGCGGGSAGGKNTSEGAPVPLIVQSITPTNGQEVMNDLSDVGGVVTLKFSERLMKSSVLDPNNAFNGLSSDVNFLDSAFARVRATPSIGGDRNNILTITPAGGVLPNGQYTVTVTRDVKNYAGDRLNRGKFDFRASFTVGPDIYSPVIRNTFPAPNQKDVPKNSKIIITFNESLNPATVTAGTVSVVNGGTNPPVPINGTLTTTRDDFEIVFTPDAATGFPPNTTIVVTLTGGASGITDVVGNPFEGDPTTPGTYQFQFETVKEPPPPNNPSIVNNNPFEAMVMFGTQDSIGTLQEAPYLANTNDLTLWGSGNPVPNSLKKIGRPGEILFDPRLRVIPLPDGTQKIVGWIYVIDRDGRSVVVVNSEHSEIVWRWRDLPDPRGLAVTPGGSTLFVTNYANSSVSMLNIGVLSVGYPLPTQAVKDITKIQNRSDLQVGRGPMGAAHAPDALLLFVGNELDNTCSVINTGTFTVNTTFSVGTAPQDAAATFFYPGIGRFAFITCLGGGIDDAGSVALWWNVPNSLQANITGFKNPKECIFDLGISCWVANSGGNEASRLDLAIAGGGFAATILPNIGAKVSVGQNPSGITIEAFFPIIVGAPTQTVITAVRGSGQLTFINPLQPARPTYSLKIPGVQTVATYMDQ